MGLFEEIRGQARLDSRRFGKSITCEIIYGDDITTINQSNLRVLGYRFSPENGYDSQKSSLLVVPLDKLEEFRILIRELQDSSQKFLRYRTNQQEAKAQGNPEDNDYAVQAIKAQTRKKIIEDALRKMIILVFVEFDNGKKAGLDPAVYRIRVESIDVNQQVIGHYTRKNMRNIKQGE